MDAQTFIRSWSALWLWMKYLNEQLIGSELEVAYTFRKARLDLIFVNQDTRFQLTWEKQGNQALITFSPTPALPKRRVEVLKTIPRQAKVTGIFVHRGDRLLRIDIDSGNSIILGAYPSMLNVYHYDGDAQIESFLKQDQVPDIQNDWLAPGDGLPTLIPGEHLSSVDLVGASGGLSMDWDNLQLRTSIDSDPNALSISAFVIDVLRHGHKPKQATGVIVKKTGSRVLKRWKSKHQKILAELDQAKRWPEQQTKLHALQMAQGMGIEVDRDSGLLELGAEFSPTGEAISYGLEPGVSLNQVIEATAKKIRKYRGKLVQLEEVQQRVHLEIETLRDLLTQDDEKSLLAFLQEHGEMFDRSGNQQSERKPYKKYNSPGGFDILVGRSSSDNDTLTFKVANKSDWWFHARQVHGSHVILRTGNQEPSHADIVAAAEHAALNSKAKHSGIVVVQYCQRKHLTKPKGSHPGAVLVHKEQSITISLD